MWYNASRATGQECCLFLSCSANYEMWPDELYLQYVQLYTVTCPSANTFHNFFCSIVSELSPRDHSKITLNHSCFTEMFGQWPHTLILASSRDSFFIDHLPWKRHYVILCNYIWQHPIALIDFLGCFYICIIMFS